MRNFPSISFRVINTNSIIPNQYVCSIFVSCLTIAANAQVKEANFLNNNHQIFYFFSYWFPLPMKDSSPWKSNTMLLGSNKKSAFLSLLSNRLLFLTRGPTAALPSPCSQQWSSIGCRALTSRTPLPAWASEKRPLATHSLATRRHFLTPPPPFFSFRFAHWRER